ncbi:unnamed protein product [Clonostachys byssicola]|uniref:Carboxypeptidase n=1 Tax=Clonostachys byssicola TaxID=160290 RepID=A0A9N9Y6T3_9HYPO|nr:unnamed protein product [Clonostachys byssicola]
MRLSTVNTALVWAAAVTTVSSQQQQPLTKPPTRTGSNFHVKEQSAALCDAGSRYYTGTVNITTEKSMFFWYFESRHQPENDPLLLWMSGGPGATGELGCFVGSGPCAVNEDGNSTRRLDYSWTDRANVIYIDQPIGVGFSEITDREMIAVSLLEGARDVYSFLSTISTEVFPQFASRPWHLTGESMGGHYVTGYTQYIASLERENAALGIEPRINISSIVIVDGYIDASRQTVGYYDFFCADWAADGRKAPLMDKTICADMSEGVPACELAGAQCRSSYDAAVCLSAMNVCNQTVGRFFNDEIRPGGWDPYDSRHKCEEPPLCSSFAHDHTLEFFNQDWVQKALGFPDFPFELIDFDTNYRWVQAGYVNLPVTRELTWILDQTNIKVLFINGNNDIIINTPGQMRMLDEQPWKDQAQYRSLGYKEWYYRDGDLAHHDEKGVERGGFWKGTDRLQFYAIDEAGHFAPHFQPEPVGAVLRGWLRK